jgi:hypothetical protein
MKGPIQVKNLSISTEMIRLVRKKNRFYTVRNESYISQNPKPNYLFYAIYHEMPTDDSKH